MKRPKAPMAVRAVLLRHLISWYPPYLLTGVAVESLAPDFRSATVRMRLRPWNRNYIGTHFGGSLYSMTDPFFMLLLLHRLGPDYQVVDAAATIEYLTLGRGTVRARFEVTDEQVARIRAAVATEGRTRPRFQTEVVDEQGARVARVDKTLYVRLRERSSPRGAHERS